MEEGNGANGIVVPEEGVDGLLQLAGHDDDVVDVGAGKICLAIGVDGRCDGAEGATNGSKGAIQEDYGLVHVVREEVLQGGAEGGRCWGASCRG